MATRHRMIIVSIFPLTSAVFFSPMASASEALAHEGDGVILEGETTALPADNTTRVPATDPSHFVPTPEHGVTIHTPSGDNNGDGVFLDGEAQPLAPDTPKVPRNNGQPHTVPTDNHDVTIDNVPVTPGSGEGVFLDGDTVPLAPDTPKIPRPVDPSAYLPAPGHEVVIDGVSPQVNNHGTQPNHPAAPLAKQDEDTVKNSVLKPDTPPHTAPVRLAQTGSSAGHFFAITVLGVAIGLSARLRRHTV